jgi:hemerythrin-like domain-containing protein
MEEGVKRAEQGSTGAYRTIAENALSYAALLREHISKEDEILYPLSERILPEGMRPGIIAGYRAAESGVAPEFSQRYEQIVKRYEAEG